LKQNNILSIKDLTIQIKKSIETNPLFQDVWVRGEISNFVHHSRGHMYLTLKDEFAKIKAVMFAGHNRYLKFIPKNGMKVLVRGEISVYERDGQYQLYIKEMQPDGIGALYQAYEELKRRLESEGWFDPAYKKSIPKLPQKIGVVTSPTGAAIRDILITIKRRFPTMEVLVFPVLVQGEFAAKSIVKAIQLAHTIEGIDVLIVGRGGGSIEELWAFNEEIVAEAIRKASIPIISAVGHETDFTIADFVADLRAPTPTAAAELSVPIYQELHERIIQQQDRLKRSLIRIKNQKQTDLNQLKKRYGFRYIVQLLEQREQQLDELIYQLQKNKESLLQDRKRSLQQLAHRLHQLNPQDAIALKRKELLQVTERLKREMKIHLEKKEKELIYKVNTLDALSPLKIMNKGFSLVYNEDKNTLYTSVQQIEPGQSVRVAMSDGELDCQVWGIKEEKRS